MSSVFRIPQEKASNTERIAANPTINPNRAVLVLDFQNIYHPSHSGVNDDRIWLRLEHSIGVRAEDVHLVARRVPRYTRLVAEQRGYQLHEDLRVRDVDSFFTLVALNICENPRANPIVLAAGDRDYCRLILSLRQKQKMVGLICSYRSLSQDLAELADFIIDLDEFNKTGRLQSCFLDSSTS